MAERTIALTFDDGPGPRTRRLSTYLKNEGIRAAFFVNGRAIESWPDGEEVLSALVEDGHLVANHTESHRSLTGMATGTPRLSNDEIVQELSATHDRIARFMHEGRWLFRPPFGDVDRATLQALESTPMGRNVGPILWDIGSEMNATEGAAADWDCWQDGSDGRRVAMKECGDLYVQETERAGKGIVLLHDPYFDESAPGQQGTVEMVEYMVPILRDKGFSFIRLDEVPRISEKLAPLPENAAPNGPPPSDAGRERVSTSVVHDDEMRSPDSVDHEPPGSPCP
jgi:peptidoglycan/xylan/chitin deacetylase (PgdA/CDA1 family)